MIISLRFFFYLFIFIFNAVITGKENVFNIIRFQLSGNDALGFRLLQLGKEAVSKHVFVMKLYQVYTL